jgi:hypothetical protein
MIGKPEWFTRRKYSGWGLTPQTWQGYAYIAVMIVPLLIFQALPFWDSQTRFIVTILWVLVFGIDTIDIMIRLKRDERETMHEAIAERNSAWFMVIVLAIGIAYEAARSAVTSSIAVDPFLAVALIGGMLIKMVSNVMLERKD